MDFKKKKKKKKKKKTKQLLIGNDAKSVTLATPTRPFPDLHTSKMWIFPKIQFQHNSMTYKIEYFKISGTFRYCLHCCHARPPLPNKFHKIFCKQKIQKTN